MLKAQIYNSNKSHLFEKALAEVEDFFEISGPYKKPIFVLLPDRAAVNEAYGRKTEDWVVAWNSGRYVFLLEPTSFESESKHAYSDEEYNRLIKHELTHYFFTALAGGDKPRWLLEGIGVVASGQLGNKGEGVKLENFLDYYAKTDSKIYREAGQAVKLLLERYGKPKLLEFVRALRGTSNSEEVARVFEGVYGLPLEYRSFV